MADKRANIYEQDLDRISANYQPLTPLSFLEWSEAVYPDKTAVIHGDRSYTYREFGERCRRLASALARRCLDHGSALRFVHLLELGPPLRQFRGRFTALRTQQKKVIGCTKTLVLE